MSGVRFELPRLFPALGVTVTLELTSGLRLPAQLVETGQGLRWIVVDCPRTSLPPQSWGQWSPEVRGWEAR